MTFDTNFWDAQSTLKPYEILASKAKGGLNRVKVKKIYILRHFEFINFDENLKKKILAGHFA